MHPFRITKFYLLFLLFFISACHERLETTEGVFHNKDGTKSPRINLEIADTESARNLGLMYRKEMAKTSGMFFIFHDEQIRSFWMKNTYLPLDIIFLDKTKKVVSVSKNAIPHTLKKRESTDPAMYVVEVNAGLSEEWGVARGSILNTKE